MKVAVSCTSPLLQKSLELFLDKHLNSALHSDILIRDEKCHQDPKCFYIGSDESADLKKPFSKSQLILALEKHYASLHPQKEQQPKERKIAVEAETLNFSILEKRIESLTQEYQANILQVVKAFYEN